MGMQDRDWYREEKRQQAKQAPGAAPWKPKRARPVLFVHYLAGFWPGLIGGIMIGLIIGLLIAR